MAGKLKSRYSQARRQTPFCYRPGKTILHRMPAGLKLLCVMVLSTAACFFIPGLVAAILLITAASIAARIPPWELLKGSRPLAVLSVCIMLLNWQNPALGAITVLRIFVPFATASLLFAVTTMRELRLSLKKVFGDFFSLGISLMLGFIPRFFDLWETANLACEARSCKKLRRLVLLIPLVTELMMEAAANTALALEARGLGYSE